MMGWNPARKPYINLATYRKTGAEVRTPVWIAENAGTLYVFSESKAGKVKRIRANGRARIAACDVRGNLKSDWLDASARIVTDSGEIAGMYAAFARKYGWQMRILNLLARLSGRYNRRAIIAISLSPAVNG